MNCGNTLAVDAVGWQHGSVADSETWARKAQAKWILREDLGLASGSAQPGAFWAAAVCIVSIGMCPRSRSDTGCDVRRLGMAT